MAIMTLTRVRKAEDAAATLYAQQSRGLDPETRYCPSHMVRYPYPGECTHCCQDELYELDVADIERRLRSTRRNGA